MSREPIKTPESSRSDLCEFFRDCFIEVLTEGNEGRYKLDGDSIKLVLVPRVEDIVLDTGEELVADVLSSKSTTENDRPRKVWVLLPLPAPEVLDHEGIAFDNFLAIARRSPHFIAYFLNADGVQAPYLLSTTQFCPYDVMGEFDPSDGFEEDLANHWLTRLREDYVIGHLSTAKEAA